MIDIGGLVVRSRSHSAHESSPPWCWAPSAGEFHSTRRSIKNSPETVCICGKESESGRPVSPKSLPLCLWSCREFRTVWRETPQGCWFHLFAETSANTSRSWNSIRCRWMRRCSDSPEPCLAFEFFACKFESPFLKCAGLSSSGAASRIKSLFQPVSEATSPFPLDLSPPCKPIFIRLIL